MKPQVIPEGTSATFADYFKLNAYIEDILDCFGYSYRRTKCELPRHEIAEERVAALRSHLDAVLPHAALTHETARREFLIAPVLMEVVRETGAEIKVEYPLEIEERLKGTLDYFLRAEHTFLVVEAKQGDLQKGFNQLAVELVALDRWAEDSTEPRFYGAVSMGNVWQFGFVERSEKQIVEDINTYSVPTNLEDVVRILVGLLAS
ncbi:MAG: hypothetical protein GY856_20340 [bacterium]|nr:hypothetical protein [bacterium]